MTTTTQSTPRSEGTGSNSRFDRIEDELDYLYGRLERQETPIWAIGLAVFLVGTLVLWLFGPLWADSFWFGFFMAPLIATLPAIVTMAIVWLSELIG